MFKNNQSQLYNELGARRTLGQPKDQIHGAATRFFSGTWSVEKRHNKDASLFDEVRDRMGRVNKQDEVKISVKDVENGNWEMVNWKAAGPDGVRVWFKRFKSLHGLISESLQGCLDSGEVQE